jgi:YD repeat-containing protein
MKSKLFQTLMFLCAIILFASCKKETIGLVPAEAPVLNEPATVSGNIASLTATKKLQKIMWNGSATTPFVAFTYDTEGRLVKTTDMYGDITTYTFKDSTVLIKRKKPGVAKALDSLNGKLNSKGFLTSLKGYKTFNQGGQTVVCTYNIWHTYNSAGQLTKISSSAKSNGTIIYVKQYNTWLNGNLSLVKTTMSTGYTATTTYTYDVAKTDKRGVWTNELFPYWTDNLVGVRAKNLLTKTGTVSSTGSDQYNQTWTLNAEGYPAASTFGYGGFVVNYTYTFQ